MQCKPAGFDTRAQILKTYPITRQRLERAIQDNEIRTIKAGTRMILVAVSDVQAVIGGIYEQA
jgi:hypothetical protein